MKNKLEVGMYVRYKRGSIGFVDPVDKIGKIINQINNSDIYELDNNNNIFEDDVIKARFNIIDLVKIGDYVNGHRVIFVNDTFTYASVEVETSGEATCEIIPKNNIKSILTKEQMEQMSYRIGE